MANIKSAIKRARQNPKRRLHNASLRSRFRTYLKKVVYAIERKDKEAAKEAYQAAVPEIDKMVTNKLIHANKAARHKSRLFARIKQLAD